MQGTFVADLLRRRVPQIVGVYLAVGWGLLEFSDWAVGRFGLPTSITDVVIVAWLVGLPIVAGLAWKLGRSGPLQTLGRRPPQERSVAVLPFENLSPDPGNDFLADGISDEIIVALTRVRGLRVASRTSSFAFRNRGLDVRALGSELNVTSVLEGSVQRVGERLRVHAQLVNTEDGYHLWSERFDRDMSDVFEIEDEIAESVAEAMELIFRPPGTETGRRLPPTTVGAYEYYLRGRQFFHKRTRKSLLFAREMFERAVEVDPEYALAHVGVANSISLLCMYYPAANADLSRAALASARALELDPGLSEAHAAHGLTLFLDQNVEEAFDEFEQAIALDPRSFEAHYFFGRACFQQGRFDRAWQLFDEACAIQEDHEAAFFSGQSLEVLERHDEAMEAYRRAAVASERYLALNPDDARAATFLAVALRRLGRDEDALDRARQAVEVDPTDAGVQYNVACFHAVAGETELALDRLEAAVRAGFGNPDWLQNDPDLASIRDDPRFHALMGTSTPSDGS